MDPLRPVDNLLKKRQNTVITIAAIALVIILAIAAFFIISAVPHIEWSLR